MEKASALLSNLNDLFTAALERNSVCSNQSPTLDGAAKARVTHSRRWRLEPGRIPDGIEVNLAIGVSR